MEMAFVLPLLILLLFGIIEFSIVLYDKAMVTHAAREGARYGVMWAPSITDVNGLVVSSYKYTCSQIETVVINWLSGHLISFSTSDQVKITRQRIDPVLNKVYECVTPDDILCINSDDILTITVEYPYSFLLLPNFVKTLSGKITLKSVVQMKCEH